MEGNDTGQVELGVVGPGSELEPGVLGVTPESGEGLAPVPPPSSKGEPAPPSGARPAAPGEREEGIDRSEALDAGCEPWPAGGDVALAT